MKKNLSKNSVTVLVMVACAGLMVQACAKSRTGFHGQSLQPTASVPEETPVAPPAPALDTGSNHASLRLIQASLPGSYKIQSRTCVAGSNVTSPYSSAADEVEAVAIEDEQNIRTVTKADGCVLKSVRSVVSAEANGAIELKNPLETRDAISKNGVELAANDTSCTFVLSGDSLMPSKTKGVISASEEGAVLILDEETCAHSTDGLGKMKIELKKNPAPAPATPQR